MSYQPGARGQSIYLVPQKTRAYIDLQILPIPKLAQHIPGFARLRVLVSGFIDQRSHAHS